MFQHRYHQRFAAIFLVLVVGLVALSGCGSSVQHHTKHQTAAPPTARAIYVARYRAQRYWHVLPCNGAVIVKVGSFPDPAVAAESSWTGPNLPYSNCEIALTPQIVSFGWRAFCQIVVHEIGHLLGHGHSPNPSNVMYPYASPANTPRVCYYRPTGLPPETAATKAVRLQSVPSAHGDRFVALHRQ